MDDDVRYPQMSETCMQTDGNPKQKLFTPTHKKRQSRPRQRAIDINKSRDLTADWN